MQNLSGIYVFCSDEPFLKNDSSSKLVTNVKNYYKDRLDALDIRIYTSSDFGTSQSPKLALLENELLDPGFFTEFKIIKLYLKDLDALTTSIFETIADINPRNILLIVDLPRINASYLKVDAKDIKARKKSKLTLETRKKNSISYLKFINANINILYPPDEKELPSWINQRARLYNLSFDNNAMTLLVNLCEGNLSLIDQTLDIMSMTLKNTLITEEKVSNYFSKDSRYSLFDFTKALLDINSSRALNVLNSICNEHGSQKNTTIFALIRELEKTFNCIKTIKDKQLFHMSMPEKTAFFMANQIPHPKTQAAILKAASEMPDQFFALVNKQIVKASLEYSSFDIDAAYQTLQNIAVMFTNSNAIVNLRAL